MRYEVRGVRQTWLGDEPTRVVVDAADADDATRRAGMVVVDTVRPVPDDEGRGVLWRLWRRLRG
jgi:hypothetical protein